MGFNIEDVSGNSASGGPDSWVYEIDLWDHVDEVSADFEETFLGFPVGDAPSGYTYSALSTYDYGTIVTDGTTGEWTFFMDRDAVLDDAADQSITFTITGWDGGTNSTDSITINLLICICRGTLVETPDGPKPVENLAIGDRVRTAEGKDVDLQWVGSRKVTPDEIRHDPSLQPVRISKGALDGTLPSRDLWVSPNHKILVRDWRAELLFSSEEVLVPAKALVDDSKIVHDTSVDETEYFHLLFENHEIILTEGAPTESFFPGPVTLRMLAPEALESLFRQLPHLKQAKPYGTTARPCLTAWEGKILRRTDRIEGLNPGQFAA